MAPKPKVEVAQVINSWPTQARVVARRLRRLIFETAERHPEIGPLTETLKWGEPAYLTEKSRSGSTLRFGWKPGAPDQLCIYFHCRTTLVDEFRSRFPELCYVGNRAIELPLSGPLPEDVVGECVAATLTYHRRRAARAVAR